ncbi:MAG: biotin transporter BioY [Candidatus Methanoperedens sp.]|nr:biotin transporter BioY [Candidatus Methanoperedens sp.]MCZ7369730.1 biotin transporter BioY [Candidatus Methanoperedens sp.]
MSEFNSELKNISAKYESIKYDLFKWRFESTFANKVVLALGFACLTGLLAQLRFYLPYTPVPVTGQVFAVLLSGVVLGKWYGGLSQGFYTAIGVLGVPWFADAKSGMAVLTGVTGGYIIGFIAASLIIGWFTDMYIKSRGFVVMFSVMLLGIAVIYLAGMIQLAFVLGVNAQKAIELGVLPFVGVDIYKALIDAAIATAIVPKTGYGNELDSR